MDANLEPVDGAGEDGLEGNGSNAPERGQVAGNEPHLTRDLIKSEVQKVFRDPWQRILTDYIGTAPTLKALQKFADKSPDRWIQGAVMLAQLAGYSKEINVNHGGVVGHVHTLSDADISNRLNETRQKLAGMNKARSLAIPATATGSATGLAIPVPVSLPVQGVSHRETAVRPSNIEDVPYQDHPSAGRDESST